MGGSVTDGDRTASRTRARRARNAPRTEGPPSRLARRVLVLVGNNTLPADRRVWSICRALASEGHEVVAVCPQDDARALARHERLDGVEIHRFPRAKAGGRGLGGYLREFAGVLWHTWRLAARLSQERPFDAVHACNPPDFLLLAAWPARRRGARSVFDQHDLTPELFLTRFGDRHRWLHRLALTLERVSFSAADVVLSTNESYRRVAMTRGRKRGEEVFVVRNGPDLRRFRPVAPDPAMKRGRPLLLAYAGILGPQDGAEHAVRALALLGRSRTDWHAIFAGEGDALPELERLTAELGLEDRVEFVGWLDDAQLARLLSSADVGLEPAPRSPLNDASTMTKIAEYMAMSRPVVAFDLRESRFTAAEAAVYAEPNDVAAFAARIAELLDDPERRAEMGRIGRERVERELSWEHSEHNLVAAYSRVLGSHASPRTAGR